MVKNVFSVPIFFIVFRETLEASIIVAVLLGLVEQLVLDHPQSHYLHPDHIPDSPEDESNTASVAKPEGALAGTFSAEEKQEGGIVDTPRNELDAPVLTAHDDDTANAAHHINQRRIIRKLRIQIFAGSAVGLLIALAIGAAFIAIWFTQASNLWSKSEELWEGIFSLIASLMIFVMGVSMLKLDRAKAKWRVKIQHAFDGSRDRGARTGRWVLFLLPLITVLREGMEAVIFVGGVSLGQPATSIPLAAIIGIVAGLLVGWLIYAFASRSALRVFMIVITNLLLLIGAGLFSKAAGDFAENSFNRLVGADVDDIAGAGEGPGSYDVRGNVWHLNCCSPEANFGNQGWTIFNAIFGWTNSASLASVLSYVFYWIAVIAVLFAMKFREGRTSLLGYHSAAGKHRQELAAARDALPQ